MMSSTQTAGAPQGFGFNLKLFGIPVTVEITFILMAVVLGRSRMADMTLLIEWIAVVFFSILVHEFGHALVGRAYGLAPRIRLYAFGGSTSWAAGRDITPLRSILLSVAGPGAGLALGGLVFLFKPMLQGQGSWLVHVTVQDLLWANIGWSLLNLLPIRPLDGGNIAYSIEELITGNKKGRVTRVGSLVLAGAAALWALQAGQYWILLLTALMALSNGQQLFLDLKQRLDRPLRSHMDEAWQRAGAGDAAAAVMIAERELESARSDEARRETSWILVAGHYRQGNTERAREELNKLQTRFGADAWRPFGDELDAVRAVLFFEAVFDLSGSPVFGYAYAESLIRTKRYEQALEICSNPTLQEYSTRLYLLLESAAFQDAQYAVSAKAGEMAFARDQVPEVAYNVACAFARNSEIGQAVKWIKIALDKGFKDRELLNTDTDLEALRGSTEFELLRGARP